MERIKEFKLWPIIVWLIIWEAASIIIGEKILIASPFDTLSTLWSLLKTSSLYIAITTSLLHVLTGFLIALILGFILGVEAFYHKHLKELIDPFMAVIKSIPVASFIILVLIGINMIKEGKEEEEKCDIEIGLKALLGMGIATSIDALAVGLSFAMNGQQHIYLYVMIIGIVTFIISVVGTNLGSKVGELLGSKAHYFGGTVLIILGLKALIG